MQSSGALRVVASTRRAPRPARHWMPLSRKVLLPRYPQSILNPKPQSPPISCQYRKVTCSRNSPASIMKHPRNVGRFLSVPWIICKPTCPTHSRRSSRSCRTKSTSSGARAQHRAAQGNRGRPRPRRPFRKRRVQVRQGAPGLRQRPHRPAQEAHGRPGHAQSEQYPQGSRRLRLAHPGAAICSATSKSNTSW